MTSESPRQNQQSLLKTTIIDGRQEIIPRVVKQVDEADEAGEDEHERLRAQQPQVSLEEFLEGMFGAEKEFDPSAHPDVIPPPVWLKSKFKTKSAVIRYLFQERGLSVKEISKHTGFLYQQCRNVLTNELKRGPNESFKLGADDQVVRSLVPLLPKKKD